MKQTLIVLLALWVLAVLVLGGLARAQSPTGPQWQWMQRTYSGPAVQNPSTWDVVGMVHEAGQNRTLLFGGHYYSSRYGHYYYNHTYARDVASWVSLSPKTLPPSRGYHDLAYDPKRGVVVLFGGYNAKGPLGDTWEWTGSDWKQVQPKTNPPARYAHQLVYDSRRGKTVLFGGHDGAGYLNDTWEWDGADWKKIPTSASPAARAYHAMAFDASTGVTVLFGGDGKSGGKGVQFGDTWKYDGTNWTPIFVGNPPSKRAAHTMCYDTQRKVVVLFGGRLDSNTRYAETWEWDGAKMAWTLRPTPPKPSKAPSARYNHAMIYDAALGQPVLFGGYDGAYRNDTWDYYQYTAPECVFKGPGHAAGGLGLKIFNNSRPVIGKTFSLTFQNSPRWIPGSGFNLFVIGIELPTPFTLKPPAVVSNALLYSIPIAPAFQSTGNPVTFPIPIPNVPPLIGQKFCLQGGSYETTGGFRLTDAIVATIQ